MTSADYCTGLDYAESQDSADPLGHFRDEFNFPVDRNGLSCVYLCGNSLGLQPKLAVRYVEEELADWAALGVEGHLVARRPWLSYHRLATDGLAKLTGSEPREVVAMNSLTVNLHVMMTSFYRPNGQRRKIVIESTAFPSDRFAAMSQLGLHGHDPAADLLEWTPRVADGELLLEDIETILADNEGQVALLLLPGVQYYSGQVLPMKDLCRLAREAGAAIGLDLAHAIGNVPMKLHDWGPDFAAWCSYKYLNAGPGAIAGAFVHTRHLDNDPSGKLLGWWGHDEATRFRMAKSFTPSDGAELWQLSNPPILALAPVVASLELFAEAGIDRLRAKSERLTGYLDFLLETHFAGRIGTITPRHARGCQLSLVVRDASLDARDVFDRLAAQNVIGDWREPNVIRVAPAPLYNSYGDVYEFACRLSRALGDERVDGAP